MVSGSDPTRPGQASLRTDLDEQRLEGLRLESLGRLAGGVAHDFNNVLGVILGYVELARMQLGPESGTARRHLAAALSTLDRARTLTARLLTFVRGRPTDEEGRVDPNAVVDDMRDLLAETLDRRIMIRVTLANDTPWVELEREHLAHALLNLCLDAAERMPDGGLLTVDVRRSEVENGAAPVPPGAYARIDVRDTGTVPPAPGSRGVLPTALGVAQELAGASGGALTVGSDEDGHVASLWLPGLGEIAHSIDDTPAARPEPCAGGTILVVDDEPGVREVTRAHLEHAGYAVREAETAARAIDLVTAAPEVFDAVLLDLHLPDASGSEVASVLETLSPAPALVIVTGDPAWADEVGISPETPRLAKPFLREGLLDAVRRACAGRPRRPW